MLYANADQRYESIRLVNSRRKNETKSIAETNFAWSARGLKDGDEVQFYVYDSSGASAKSPQIPVQGKAGPVTTESSSGKEESKTKQYSIGTLSSSGPTGEQAGVDTSSGTTATRTRSGRIPTAPPPSSDVPTASAASAADYPSLTSNGPSAAESLSSGTGAATGEATPSLTLAATASAATTTTTAGSAASPKPQDRTNLFLGLIGLLIALALLLALVLYV
ncbi:hypothetical protein JCM3774_004313 [Rhodotorula dairenensis]